MNSVRPRTAFFSTCILIPATVFLMISCSPETEYERPVVADYSLVCTSPDEVVLLRFDAHVWSAVPSKIVEIAWNDKFILAKQQEMEPGTLTVSQPAKFHFWVIDVIHTNNLGPFDEVEANRQLFSMGQTNLNLKAISAINWTQNK